MVLHLIAKAAAHQVRPGRTSASRMVPFPSGTGYATRSLQWRNASRSALALVECVRNTLARAEKLPTNPAEAETVVRAEVKNRVRRSGRGNVSRAVSELVRAGLLTRHYQGYRVDHQNRRAQRQLVYTVTKDARLALGRSA